MDESNSNSPCKDYRNQSDHLSFAAEVDLLKQDLAQKEENILALEAELVKSSLKITNLHEQVATWREKYERLHDSHKRVQKLNQVLEDKLLQMVEKMKIEKSQLTKDIATLSVRLADSKHSYSLLQKENERYKNDMNLAIQLLQCKPDNFVAQRLDNLPVDTQARVSQYVMSKAKTSGSQTKNSNDIGSFDASEYEFNISASLMSKILEDSIHDTITKHCDTCTCSKSQAKPFFYNDSHYSVSTQTQLTGEMKNSYCLNCNVEMKSLHSNLSIGSASPCGIKLVNDKTYKVKGPVYIIPQPKSTEVSIVNEKIRETESIDPKSIDDKHKLEASIHNKIITRIGDDLQKLRKNNGLDTEPAIHHKLCDRTKTSVSSMIGSTNSLPVEEALLKDIPNSRDKAKNESQYTEDMILRKGSQSSMGDISRTSSVAKSMSSTQKSHTHVGPGPRFCSLRVQAGSKNILLDNAQPDVPPVLYKRQSRDLNDDFVDVDKNDEDTPEDKNNVLETTLIDVHVENTNKDHDEVPIVNSINPILLNVSSSPLEPLKAHTTTNNSEQNNNEHRAETENKCAEIENIMNNTQDREGNYIVTQNDTSTIVTNEIKIFNFERYEQSKLSAQYGRSLRKIDMSQLHSLENTKISKDLPPQGDLPVITRKTDAAKIKPETPTNVNVYTNLAQTHMKSNELKKKITNDPSSSSLSSDDSAAILQKQQLLRVAEWVEQNLEQHNSYHDPSSMDEEAQYTENAGRSARLTKPPNTLNESVLNMPHPVSKYSKSFTKEDQVNTHRSEPQPGVEAETSNDVVVVSNVPKETVFPVECDEVSVTVDVENGAAGGPLSDESYKLSEPPKFEVEKISREELARMEYNVKKFLMGGSYWERGRHDRPRRTTSKTETDV